MSQQLKQKSWSYSQLSGYEQCPHAHMYRRIVKLPEQPSWHLQNGNYVHSLAENYLLGKVEVLPKELAKFKTEFENLKKANAVAEKPMVLDKDWKYVGGEESWMAENAWLRLKIDAAIGDNFLIDFKTGKQYDEHVKQGQLYANVAMMCNPDLNEVDVEFWYLGLGTVSSYTFKREDLEAQVAIWNHKVEVMHKDSTFEPRPHQWCKNCYVKHLCPAQNS